VKIARSTARLNFIQLVGIKNDPTQLTELKVMKPNKKKDGFSDY